MHVWQEHLQAYRKEVLDIIKDMHGAQLVSQVMLRILTILGLILLVLLLLAKVSAMIMMQ